MITYLQELWCFSKSILKEGCACMYRVLVEVWMYMYSVYGVLYVQYIHCLERYTSPKIDW
jgi:hypothetical protein